MNPIEPYTLTDGLWVLDRTITEEIHDIGIGADVRLGIALFPVEDCPKIDPNTPCGFSLPEPIIAFLGLLAQSPTWQANRRWSRFTLAKRFDIGLWTGIEKV